MSFIHRLVSEIPLNEPDNKHCKANDIIFFVIINPEVERNSPVTLKMSILQLCA